MTHDTRYRTPAIRRVSRSLTRVGSYERQTRRDGRRFFHAECHVCDEGVDLMMMSGFPRFPASPVSFYETDISFVSGRECERWGHWHARGAFGSRAPRLRAPVRATAGGTQASRLGARTRDVSVEEGHPPRRRISGFWRGFVAGNPPSPRSLRGASVPAAARARFGTRAGL